MVRMLKATKNFRVLVFVFAVVSIGCAFGGCNAPTGHVELATQSDRLMASYADLKDGRFAVIADFEDATHLQLVQFVAVSDEAVCVLDPVGGREDTGGAGIRFTASSPDDAVVLTNRDAVDWHMKEDWRAYDLLLLSAKSPRAGLELSLLITAGPDNATLAVETKLPLDEGWNLIRIDLGELDERVPLDDVRSIQVSIADIDAATTVYFDDFVLTSSRRNLVGSQLAPAGTLYVQQIGRRWKVGSPDSFEITFSHGQIVEYHHLPSDPYRLKNLVRNTVLGPTPVVVADGNDGDEPEHGDFEGGFSALGAYVRARQEMIELNERRVIIESEWRFSNVRGQANDDSPYHRWRYTIYPSGEVFVEVATTAATEDWRPKRLGLVVSLANLDSYDLQTHSVGALDDPEILRHITYGTARSDIEGPLVQFILYDSHKCPRMLTAQLEEPPRTCLLAAGSAPGATTQTWACCLILGTSAEVSGADVMRRAIAYARPATLEVQVGKALTEVYPNGFDPSSGAYQLATEGGKLRFTVPEKEHLYCPTFEIALEEESEAWVYVNHLLLGNSVRLGPDRLLVTIPDVVSKRTTVEVLQKVESRREQGP